MELIPSIVWKQKALRINPKDVNISHTAVNKPETSPSYFVEVKEVEVEHVFAITLFWIVQACWSSRWNDALRVEETLKATTRQTVILDD